MLSKHELRLLKFGGNHILQFHVAQGYIHITLMDLNLSIILQRRESNPRRVKFFIGEIRKQTPVQISLKVELILQAWDNSKKRGK